MSGKIVTATHTRLPVNSFLCLENENKITLCGCSANCNAEDGQEMIENSNCSSVIARDFKRIRSVTRENQRRTRDREPSFRISVPKVLKRKLVSQRQTLPSYHKSYIPP